MLHSDRLKNITTLALIPFLMIGTFWLTAFQIGLTTKLGFERGHGEYSSTFGGFVSSSFDYTIPIGTKIFYASKGSKFYINYEIKEAKAGGLVFYLSRISSPLIDTSDYAYSKQNLKGHIVLEAKTSGIYHLYSQATQLGGKRGTSGYDVTWTANWGQVIE